MIVMWSCAHDPPPQAEEDSVSNPDLCGENCFDRDAATRALDHAVVEIQMCGGPDDSEKSGNALITFEPSGHVSKVVLDAHLERSNLAGCIAAGFRKSVIPEFQGESQIVAKVFSIRGSKDAGV